MRHQQQSPFTWSAVTVTALGQNEQADHQELILDEEGLATWQHRPSFVARFIQHTEQLQADQPGAVNKETD